MDTVYVVLSVVGALVIVGVLAYRFMPGFKEKVQSFFKQFSKENRKKAWEKFKNPQNDDLWNPESKFAQEMKQQMGDTSSSGQNVNAASKTTAAPVENNRQPQPKVAKEPKPKKEGKTWKEWIVTFIGTPLNLYREAPASVQAKKYSLGMIAFVLVAISATIAGIVYSSIFGALYFVPTFIAWFLLMWVLVRGLFTATENIWVGMIKNIKEPKRICKQTLPLIIIAAILFFTVAAANTTFFMMLMFKNEIAGKIEDNRVAKNAQSQTEMNNKIAALEETKAPYENKYQDLLKKRQNQIETKQKAINTLQTTIINQRQNLNAEVGGEVVNGTTGIAGDGPAAQQQRATIEAEEGTLAQMKADLDNFTKNPDAALTKALADRDKAYGPIDQQEEQIRADQKANAGRIKHSKMDGLMDRYNALRQVADNNPLYKLYFFLFLAIEMMALFFKYSFGYDTITIAAACESMKEEQTKRLTETARSIEADVNHRDKVQKLYVKSVQNDENNKLAYVTAKGGLLKAQQKELNDINDAIEAIKAQVEKMSVDQSTKDRLIQEKTEEYIWTKSETTDQLKLN